MAGEVKLPPLVQEIQVELESAVSSGDLKKIDALAKRLDFVRENANLTEEQSEDLAKTLRELNAEFLKVDKSAKSSAKELNNLTKTQKSLNTATTKATLGTRGFSTAANNANQILFSFGDAVQDGAQFQFGFAQGARAVGNNLAFASEQIALAAQKAGGLGNAFKAIGSSLLGPAGIILAINAVITAITVLSQRSATAAKKLEDFYDGIIVTRNELSKFAGEGLSNILGTDESAVKQLEDIDRALNAVQKRTSEFRDNDFKTSLIDPFQSDATNPVAQLNAVDQALGGIVDKLDTQDILEIQAFEAIKRRLQERRAELQAQILINKALEESVETIKEATSITELGRARLDDTGGIRDIGLGTVATGDRVGSLAFDLSKLSELQDQFNKATTDAEREAIARRIELRQEEINRKKAFYEQDANNAKQSFKQIAGFANMLFGSLNQLNQAQSDENEKQARKRFETAKKLALSQSIVNGAAAFVDVLREEKGGATKKIIAASLIAAATATQIAAIKRTSFNSGSTGGSSGGGGGAVSSGSTSSRTESTFEAASTPLGTKQQPNFNVQFDTNFSAKGMAQTVRIGEQEIIGNTTTGS